MPPEEEPHRRIGDNLEVPPMNGTLKSIVDLIGTPLDTPEKQAQAIREIATINLHTYLMQKEMRDLLNAILQERKSIIDKIVDKGLVPLLFMMLIAILGLLFKPGLYIPTP